MDEQLLEESAWARGWRDLWTRRASWRFWIPQIFGGGLLALFVHPAAGLLWVLGLTIAVGVAALAGAPLRQRNELRAALRPYFESRIEFRGGSPYPNPLWSWHDDEVAVGLAAESEHTRVWRARLRNGYDHAVRGLNAEIRFFPEGSNEPVVEVIGARWADEAHDRDRAGENPNQIDLPPGRSALLVVVMKHLNDDRCYAFSNESVMPPHRQNGCRKPDWQLPERSYRIEIELAGEGIAGRDHQTFGLTNDGPGGFFEVEPC